MNASAVSGQHPFEVMPQQSLHRASLLGPRVPTNAAGSVERVIGLGPPQMIAGEKVSIAIQQNCVASRVSRRRDRQQVLIKLNGLAPGQYALDSGSRASYVIAMHHAPSLEMPGPLLVIRHIVAMRQEHKSHAAHLLDSFHQRDRKA